MQEGKDPYSAYDLNDWAWEFLRRNPRYRRRYRAVQRAKEREWAYEVDGEPLYLAEVWAGELCERLSLLNPPRIDDPDSHGEYYSLPNPDIQRDKFQYSPVERFPAVAVNGPADPNPEGLFGSPIPKDYRVTVEIDIRCKWEVILSDLKKQIRPYLKGRSHIQNYKSYLDVWDLRREGFTDTQIAEELWPEEYERIGGRDCDTGEKGSLMQRVDYHKKAAKKLIENSFPPKKRSPKIKK